MLFDQINRLIAKASINNALTKVLLDLEKLTILASTNPLIFFIV